MTQKISLFRKWTEPIPLGRDGTPIPNNLWPRRRKHVWVVRWFAPGPDGKMARPSRTFLTRDEAEKCQAEKSVEFSASVHSRRRTEKIALDHFIDEFRRLRTGPRGQRLKESSLSLGVRCLKRFSDFVGAQRSLSDISPADAARFFAKLRDEDNGSLSPATINKTKRTLAAAFSVAASPLGYIKENPFRGLKGDRVPETPIRYVCPAEFAAILTACRELPGDPAIWWEAFFLCCYTAGLRYSEVVNLTWPDVNFEAETIRVAPKAESKSTLPWCPKDYESRTIPIPSRTVRMLMSLHERAVEGHAYVFLSPERLALIKVARSSGRWKDDRALLNNFQRSFRLIIKRAAKGVTSLANWKKLADGKKIPDKPTICLHDLRRSAVTNWSKVANIQTVMAMAGHSNIETTRRYYAATTMDQIDKVRQASEAALSVTKSQQSDPKLTPKGVSGGDRIEQRIHKSLETPELKN